MSRWVTRALLALALPALVAPALTVPATAAAGPLTEGSLPSIGQVAKVYPHLRAGSATLDPGHRVDGPGRTCRSERGYRGTDGVSGRYVGRRFTMSARRPALMVQSVRFEGVRSARTVVRAFDRYLRNCRRVTDRGETTTARRLRTGRLGDQRVGMTLTVEGPQGFASRYVVARSRAVVTVVVATAVRGLPSARKAVRVARMAVARAR